ncbi:MAG TPA: hypothetical protein VKR59_20370 [Terriglobales bacterium]|nr:hypothetical protein [Terriglobales bacterium]
MPLFTVLLEFDGGTYVSQFRSASANNAVRKYAAELVGNRQLCTPRLRKRLSSAIAEDKPVALSGIRGVWCCSASIGDKLALMNIIETSDLSRPRR